MYVYVMCVLRYEPYMSQPIDDFSSLVVKAEQITLTKPTMRIDCAYATEFQNLVTFTNINGESGSTTLEELLPLHGEGLEYPSSYF